MEIIFSAEFGRLFFLVGTIVVTTIVWLGYKRNSFSPWFAWLTTLVFVSYMIAFIWYRYQLGEVSEHVESEPSYIVIAILHGIISLAAIVHACIAFVAAERAFGRGENYFRAHKKMTLTLIILWPLALLSGFLL